MNGCNEIVIQPDDPEAEATWPVQFSDKARITIDGTELLGVSLLKYELRRGCMAMVTIEILGNVKVIPPKEKIF